MKLKGNDRAKTVKKLKKGEIDEMKVQKFADQSVSKAIKISTSIMHKPMEFSAIQKQLNDDTTSLRITSERNNIKKRSLTFIDPVVDLENLE